MVYHSVQFRTLAVVLFFLCGCDLARAMNILILLLPTDSVEQIGCVRSFIQYNVTKFCETGSVQDQPHPPRDKRIPEILVACCSIIFKQGHTGPDGLHYYFTSIKQACKLNPILAAVCNNYHVSPPGLLKRMYQVDPDLVRKTLDFKMDLTPVQKYNRMLNAQFFWNCLVHDPQFLYHVYWIDEVSIWFVPSNKAHIQVYCDAHDENVRMVIKSHAFATNLRPHEKVVVRAMACVNGLVGPLFLEFTTGTTPPIMRQFIPPNSEFKVSIIGAQTR